MSATDPRALFDELKEGSSAKIAEPDLDAHVNNIFSQTYNHRDRLIKFYIWYTCVLSALVMTLLFAQAAVRLFGDGKDSLELIPERALSLVVVGMFGQFIGLLTIVTKKAWGFKPFLDHALRGTGPQQSAGSKKKP
jgi:glucan phosphoethanolaminetransferase (alkaline phosphatase superfamily)